MSKKNARNSALEHQSKSMPPKTPTPTVTVYQNADHVSGILQQLYRQPLAKGDTIEDASAQERADHNSLSGSVASKLKTSWLGSGAEIGVKMAAAADSNTKDSASGKRTSVWEYTQAYYLHVVLESLRASGMLRVVSSLSDAVDLEVGDLVEYTATFTPAQMSVFLDVLTPELVSAIVGYQIKKNAFAEFDEWGDDEAVQVHEEKTQARLQMNTELAEAVTRALRTDFRSEGTREFFGNLGCDEDGVTAITMCDRQYFTVEDTDRLLDGTFTVLGKVADGIDEDRPTLQRNKILSAISPEAIDSLVGSMQHKIDSGMAKINGEVPFDPNLSARIEGASFKVIPIAIYL